MTAPANAPIKLSRERDDLLAYMKANGLEPAHWSIYDYDRFEERLAREVAAVRTKPVHVPGERQIRRQHPDSDPVRGRTFELPPALRREKDRADRLAAEKARRRGKRRRRKAAIANV